MKEILLTVFVLTAIAQFIWLFLQYIFIKNKLSQNVEIRIAPDISIVIAAHNERENLKVLIENLGKQRFSGAWEVIIVLDRCDDDSYEYLSSLNLPFDFTLINQDKSEIPLGHSHKKSALIKGINRAKYDFILQTDADCYPSSENWIESISGHLSENQKFVIGLSHYEKKSGLLNGIIQFDTLWTASSMLLMAIKGKAYMALGRNMLFDKQLFLDSGQYGQGINIPFGDDDLLIQKMDLGKNIAVSISKDSQTISIPEIHWKSWFKQKVRHMMAGKYYKGEFSIYLFFNYLSPPFFLLAVLSFIFMPNFFSWTLGILAFKLIFSSILNYRISKLIGIRISYLNIIIYDIIHSFVIVFIGIRTLLSKKVEWH